MLFKTLSAAVFGIDASLVEVEVDIGPGRPGDFAVAGLPDIAVKESRERIKSALRNCGFDFPTRQAVTVNLAPADIRKEGSAFDLPMALGLMGCQGTFFGKVLDSHVFLGELSLDGSVRSVRGALLAALAARTRHSNCGRAGSKRSGSGSRRRNSSLCGEISAAGRGHDQRAGVVSTHRRGHVADACRSQSVFGGLARRTRTNGGQEGSRSRLRGKPQHSPDRSPGRGQGNARKAYPDDSAADIARGNH